MSSKRLWIVAAAAAALAACNTANTHIGDEDAGFGEAVAYDKAVQTINPAPAYTADSAKPGSNGDVGAQAVQRYRTGKVKQPENMGTSSGSGAGGSGAGMGSGGPQ